MTISLQFNVSLDEEHVFLRILHGDQRFNLGERVHHYSLLVLARRRLEDRKLGIEPNSQGWTDIDGLSKMLGIEPSHVNIHIFRMRRQIARTLPALPPLQEILERRRGQIRFGAQAVEIVRGSAVEAQYAASAME